MHAAPRPAAPDYGIIFNHDGTFHGLSEYPQQVDDLLEKVYGPLEGTQVGALLWCVGTDEARWPSDQLSMDGDAEGRYYSSVKGMRRSESLRAMFERGDDLYGRMVQRGRDAGMDVYVSIRMNDNHFWSDKARKAFPLAPEEMANTVRPHLTQFRKDHPEWVLGIGNAPRWAVTSWNMAIPEVREHILTRITEACAQADWDGVEIDWQRHAFHLPEHDAYRLRYTLTDFMRAIRRATDEIAEKRGRPFHLATRVGASRETNRRIGYDLETWIAEGLCDIVATNANSGNDPGVEVEEYRAMMEGTSTRLYPGFDSHGEFGSDHLLPAPRWREGWFRGLARGYYDRGASGVHLFNWHRYAVPLRPLLETLGSPGTLSGCNKVYAAVKRYVRDKSEIRYGAERDDRLLGEVPVELHRTLTGTGPTFTIYVYDDVAAAGDGSSGNIELQIDLNHLAPLDRLQVSFDGQELAAGKPVSPAALDASNPSDVSENTWLVWTLTAEQAARGKHRIEVALLERDPRIRIPIVIDNVELHINYS